MACPTLFRLQAEGLLYEGKPKWSFKLHAG